VIRLTREPESYHRVDIELRNINAALKTSKTRHVWFTLSEGIQYRQFNTRIVEDTSVEFPNQECWDQHTNTYRFSLERINQIPSLKNKSSIHLIVTFREHNPPLTIDDNKWRLLHLDWKSGLLGCVTLHVYLPEEITGRLQRLILPPLARLTRRPMYSVENRQRSATAVGLFYLPANPPFAVSYTTDNEVPSGHVLAFKLQSVSGMLGGIFPAISRVISRLLKVLPFTGLFSCA
jgi:hypothetical protein